MKLVMIDAFYLGKGRGIANYIENLLDQFNTIENLNTKILVVSTHRATNFKYSNPMIDVITLPNMPFPIWENLIIPSITMLFRPDVVHFPANSSPLIPICGKRIVTVHDTIFMHGTDIVPRSEIFRQKFGRMYLSANLRILANRYSHILTVSNCSKNDILSFLKIDRKKITVSYEGPGLLFSGGPTRIESRKNILHFASKDPRKNTKRVIEAFLKSKAIELGFKLHLVGYEETIHLKHISTHPSIYKHSFLNFNELQKIVDETFLLLYPSLYEGFGLPIVEFQRIGIPVITSKTSACAEIGSSGCFLVDPYSEFEITDSLNIFCQNPLHINELSYLSKINAQKFDWEKCAKDVLFIYDKT